MNFYDDIKYTNPCYIWGAISEYPATSFTCVGTFIWFTNAEQMLKQICVETPSLGLY